jgi:uncharacterized protein with PIN domain
MTQAEETPPSKAAPEAVTKVKFLADRMLGKLAKWLRIVGYDTVYARHLSPVGLMREGRRQGRIILTRDTRIARYKDAPPFLFIHSDRFREQLKQVVETLKLEPQARLLTRCVECNRLLAGVAKEKVKEKVPPYVWETQAEFVYCPGCQRIYWGATHKEHVLTELKDLGIIVGG